MTTFNTGNPIGSTDARDRSDNSENLDLAVNSLSQTFVDRLGVTRDTLEGIYKKSAYYRAGTFDAGYTLTNNRQTLAYGNVEYSWSGTFPKVVAASSTPETTGGISAGAWVDRTVEALRAELESYGGNKHIGTVGSVASLRGLTGLSDFIGRKVYLSGYYAPSGVGGGDFIITNDTTSSDNGGTIIVTTDGVRLKRPRKMRLYSSDFGVVGDWNGTTGTDNKTAIEAMISASNSSQPWCINQDNVGVSSVSISGKDNWTGTISGSVINTSAKPVAGASIEKDNHGGRFPTFKIDNCNKWKLKGGYVDNRYREAFYITNCIKFVNECDIKGSGINNNLLPNYYRYCYNFSVRKFRYEGMSEKPATGYYDWVNTLLFWDCSNFKIIDFDIFGGGGNGLYIASNCRDYVVDNFIITAGAMSGIQLAWSGFGLFPYRGSISNGLINGCRADGIDINNTDGHISFAKLVISNVNSVINGYNDDGTITTDGSGLATLIHVTHVDIIGCHTEDPANGGLHISHCTNINVYGGSIKKERSINNGGGGVYIQDSSDVYISGLDVSVYTGKEALKIFGALSRIRIGGKYKGVIAIPTPTPNICIYDDVRIENATLITENEILGYIPIVNSKIIAENSNALRALAQMTDVYAESTSGLALIFGRSGVKIKGGKFKGGNSGTYCHGLNYCTLDGADVIGGTGPASHWMSATSSVITNNIMTAGTGNSLLTDSACTGTIKFGNALSGIEDLRGTFNINY